MDSAGWHFGEDESERGARCQVGGKGPSKFTTNNLGKDGP
jgi:hypothetical protein